ncbi:hypothetical protein VAWG007_24470 [Aeromonas enteropelogenes]|nr:hypothetical protein VAWG007_24470 [Aeromonas enteropelogenes]
MTNSGNARTAGEIEDSENVIEASGTGAGRRPGQWRARKWSLIVED